MQYQGNSEVNLKLGYRVLGELSLEILQVYSRSLPFSPWICRVFEKLLNSSNRRVYQLLVGLINEKKNHRILITSTNLKKTITSTYLY